MRARAGVIVTGVRPTGNATARRAAEILVEKGLGFAIPTPTQKRNLVVAFAKRDMIVYGKAFDVVKQLGPVNLDDLSDVEKHLDDVSLCEIKSTAKKCGAGFKGYFFSLTTAELLVSQSLKTRFKFVLVDVHTREHLELSLSEMLGRARGIYPSWSIVF